MRREKPGQDSVTNVEKFQYLSLSLAKVQTLRIEETDPDPYLLDEKTEYIFLNEFIETRVLIICIDQSKTT